MLLILPPAWADLFRAFPPLSLGRRPPRGSLLLGLVNASLTGENQGLPFGSCDLCVLP